MVFLQHSRFYQICNTDYWWDINSLPVFRLLPQGQSAGVVRCFVVHSSQSEAVVYIGNGWTKNHQNLPRHSQWLDLQPHPIWRCWLLLVGSYGSSKKRGRKCCLRRLRVEFPKNGLSDDHKIFHAFHGQSAPQTWWIWRTSLAVSSRLQNVIK